MKILTDNELREVLAKAHGYPAQSDLPLAKTIQDAFLANNQGGECLWKHDKDGNWETGCHNMHVFTVDGPKENSHKFCPYCGAKITMTQPPIAPISEMERSFRDKFGCPNIYSNEWLVWEKCWPIAQQKKGVL